MKSSSVNKQSANKLADQDRYLQLRNKFRAALLASVAIAGTTGCSTMKSPTEWFSKDSDKVAAAEQESVSSSISDTGKGIAGQFKSMGTAVSSAMGKAKNAVTATFVSSDNPDDATSLANMPSKLEPEVWVANGQFFEAQGNYAKALDNYSQALEKQPDNEAALLSTARLYARQDQNDSAVQFFQKAITVNPENASTHNELAVLLQEQGKNADAQAAVAKAISLDPRNPRFRNNLAGMQVSVGRSDEAVNQLQQILTPAEANYNVAYLHFMNNNMASAQQHLEIALRTDPNLSRARTLLQRIGESGTAQNAMAGFNTAKQVYRTAQAITTPTQGGAGGYQQSAGPAGGQPAMAPAGSANQFAPQSGNYPSAGAPGQPGMQYLAPQQAGPQQPGPQQATPQYSAPGVAAPPSFPSQTNSVPPAGPFLTNVPSQSAGQPGVPAMQVSTKKPAGGSTVIQNQYLPATQQSPTSMPTSSMPTMRPSGSAPMTGPTSLLPPPAANRYNSP